MKSILHVVFLLSLNSYVKCNIINVTDPIFKELPPVFRIDDNQQCWKHNKLYCKMSITLEPLNGEIKSLHWKVIENTIGHPNYYNHNELFHAICISDFCSRKIMEDSLDMKSKLSQCYEEQYPKLRLKFVITELKCNKFEYEYSPRMVDIIALLCVFIYVIVIIFATYKDYRRISMSHNQFGNSIMPAFSVIANWKKLCSLNDRADFQKLKFIQGIRFYTMLLIIFCHTVCSYGGGYISNTEYFELVYKNQIRQTIATLLLFLVQTFFLISAFLLSYHVCQSMEIYEESKLRYMFYTFLNRYLRILPPVFVMIMMNSTIWVMRLFHGPVKDLYSDKEYQRCQKNWWTNLIFINNHYNESQMCYFITWYLAADTQLYLISLILLLIIWKYRQSCKIILALAISIGIFMPIVIYYQRGLNFLYRITPENSKNDNFRSLNFNIIYTSTYSNMASYMVGLCLGCFYFTLERSNTYTKYNHFLWTSLFSLLPITTILISSYDHSKNMTTILSGLAKPCYALGIGAGILAMSQQKNGIIKKLCELKLVLFLGNFTYSTYVVQYGIVFYRTATAKEPLFISDYVLVTSFAKDAVLSIFCGFLMYILIEMPALQLQKMYIPQIRHIISSKRCKKSDNLAK